KTALIAVADVRPDADLPLVLAARDDAGGIGDLDFGQLRERDARSVRRVHQDIAEPVDIAPACRLIPRGDLELPLALEQRAYGASAHSGFDERGNVIHVQAVARDPGAI